MKLYIRASLGVILLAVFINIISCDKNESKNDKQKDHMTMNELKESLTEGATITKEEPFEMRPFEPYLDKQWIGNAVCYGCYRAGQAPGQQGPSNDELLEDLQIIAQHWHMIRLYGADNDTRRILEVINENKLPIKVVQGIWLQPEENEPDKRANNIKQVLLAIELANKYPNIVNAVSVGNETQVFWSAHKMLPKNLIRYMRAVRNNVTVPVTTADDYLFWNKEESKAIAAEVDFVYTHIHPLWNGKTLDIAINWMDSVYQDLQTLHPDHKIVLGETGWATDYNAAKTGDGQQGSLIKGEVGLKAQEEFLIQMDQWLEKNKITSFLFEAFDEPWKGGPEPNEVEKNWGVYYENRTPKESFVNYLKQK